ncbi:MAG TPA: peptidase C26 [Cytophagales bacterium]|jgi:putative glutamine amidotransferase|nr:peptidase C26 [Cytophagales bacterium]
MKKKIVIGITDCEKYPNYEKWILAEPDVEVIQLGHSFSNLDDVKKCDGVLITGGDDVHPRFYGSSETHYPNAPDEFVEDRDEFEIQTFLKAQENNLPVLGICRGLQLINCILGGTLQQDLGELNKIHKRVSKDDKIHPVKISANSLLREISQVNQGEVNSSHHQAIDKLASNLKINCQAMDGTIEGVERTGRPFLLAVQWHPERMLDQDSPLSKNIKNAFLESVRKLKS